MTPVNNRLLGLFRRRSERNAESPDPDFFLQIRSISNADLTERDIPGEEADWDQWSGIPSFAASFDGFQHWGSRETCFQVAKMVLSETQSLHDRTLTELRTALLFLYRAIHHDDWHHTADDLVRARAIIAEIRDRVRRRAVD
jgi:hypothetical protein